MEENNALTRLEQDLTLVLLYLNAWPEKAGDEPVYRSWKGYNFDTLDALVEQKSVYEGNKKNKSIYLTPEGVERAKQLVSELLEKREE